MRERQEIWLKKVSIIQSWSIAALDVPIKTNNQDIGETDNFITLRKVIMSLTSTKHKEKKLFRAVDQNTRVNRVFFLINNNVEDEAREVVNVLPLI